MSFIITYNGSDYVIPEYGDAGWAENLNNYFSALSTGSLTKDVGYFPLLAEVNFGSTYGIVSEYYKSNSTNISTNGEIRLANDDTIEWRNGANDGNLSLSITDNKLQFNSVEVLTNPSNYLSKDGGTFTLTDNLHFGDDYIITNFRFASSNTTAPDYGTGVFSLGENDIITWETGTPFTFHYLGVVAGELVFNGNPITGGGGGGIATLVVASPGDAADEGVVRLRDYDSIAWRNFDNTANYVLNVVDGDITFDNQPLRVAWHTITNSITVPEYIGIGGECIVYLANDESIRWRNFADDSDLVLEVDNEDNELYFNNVRLSNQVPADNATFISGTWVPTDSSTASLTLTTTDGQYSGARMGSYMHVTASVTVEYPVTADTTEAEITLPRLNPSNDWIASGGTGSQGGSVIRQDTAYDFLTVALDGWRLNIFKDQKGTPATNADLSGCTITLTVTYSGQLITP